MPQCAGAASAHRRRTRASRSVDQSGHARPATRVLSERPSTPLSFARLVSDDFVRFRDFGRLCTDSPSRPRAVTRPRARKEGGRKMGRGLLAAVLAAAIFSVAAEPADIASTGLGQRERTLAAYEQ